MTNLDLLPQKKHKLLPFLPIANIITGLRIVFAIAMLLVAPFSAAFWVCYLGGGLSDMLDGLAARKLHQQSAAGARLDSAADAIFAAAIAAFAIVNLTLPAWIWGGIIGVAALRLTGYGLGFAKYRRFSALHTYANKITGALIFAFPLLYSLLGLTATGGILLLAAFVSSLEELLITLRSRQLDRDRKGLFLK